MTTLSNGHVAQQFEAEELSRYLQHFAGSIDSFVRVSPGGWVFPEAYVKWEQRLTNFETGIPKRAPLLFNTGHGSFPHSVAHRYHLIRIECFRPDDVVVMTYPKCGTTWTQEIVWTMRNNPNLDNPEAETALFTRSPFIDADMLMPDSEKMKNAPPEALKDMPDFTQMPMFQDFFKRCPGKNPDDGIMLQLADAMTEPRTLKTHMPFSLLNRELIDTCKVIYVVRNPKDAILSYQHHCRLMKAHGYTGSQDDFVQYFVDDMLLWGSYANHLKEAWAIRTHPNLHIVFYEDLKADIVEEINKIASFIGVTLTEPQLKNILKKTSFGAMKADDPMKMDNPAFFDQTVKKEDGTFFRKGEVGSWKGKFTPEQEAKVDAWVENNFTAVGFEFKYQ